ncbi:MAG TPA: IS21 family transposase [Cytophagales bacterium]|nr:IS21 family transposase [Cytophagales bacterium]
MANKRLRMTTLRQIIRLKAEGNSNRETHRLLGVSRKAVDKYTKRIDALAISYQELLVLEDADLNELLESPKKELHSDPEKHYKLASLFPYLEKELKRVGVTRWTLWAEYKNKNPEGYTYSRFCHHFQQWQKNKEVSMHLEHKAGDKVFVDYTGKKLEIVDRQTGEVKQVEVFVAILGASQLTYVEATASQKKEDFIGAVENALIYFGGVPKAIVPDNLKSAVVKSDKYEPVLNETFEDFAHHYGTTILPTRAAKPKDKALVEGAVKIIYTRIFAAIRNQTFFSLQDLNRTIQEKLDQHNKTPFQGKSHSRQELFNEIEKSELAPLPQESYEFKKFSWATVYKNSHIWLGEDKHYYSVPYRYTGEKVKVVYTKTRVEVHHKQVRIAFHSRDYSHYKYTTQKDHMPSTHQYKADWNPEKFIRWATMIGKETKEVIERIIENKQHPEQAYKSCVGILSFGKKYNNTRLNNACKRALYYQNFNYQTVKNILEKELDMQPIEDKAEVQMAFSFHENIRGKEYYK